jgi:caa(3)-type oxidase subunit IV
MVEERLSVRGYVIVWVILVLLTVLTVALSFVPVPGVWRVVIGLAIAFVMAMLASIFFMHLAFSPPATLAVVLVSCFWLGILLVLAYTDYFSRGMVPFTPGH